MNCLIFLIKEIELFLLKLRFMFEMCISLKLTRIVIIKIGSGKGRFHKWLLTLICILFNVSKILR